MNEINRLSGSRQFFLIVLRTMIGWHFLYEGYYKLVVPAWSSAGVPLGHWTSAGYIRAATGPVARLFQRLLDAGLTQWIDVSVKIGLLLIGALLMLGLFMRVGCWAALFLLSLFYLMSIPLGGTPQAGAEGSYLIVNKTLIEATAVCVLLAFDTGSIAGLDLWISHRKISVGRGDASPAADASAA